MARGQKPLSCLNLCLNDSIRKTMFDRFQFFISLTDFLQTKNILLLFLCSVVGYGNIEIILFGSYL